MFPRQVKSSLPTNVFNIRVAVHIADQISASASHFLSSLHTDLHKGLTPNIDISTILTFLCYLQYHLDVYILAAFGLTLKQLSDIIFN